VINTKNNYSKFVFNGEVGYIVKIELPEEARKQHTSASKYTDKNYEIHIKFDEKVVPFKYDELESIQLAYCLTIHKSQGSEYKYLVMFIHSSHYIMLRRNLLYTGITRAKKLLVLLSNSKAIQIAVDRPGISNRITFLKDRLIQNNLLSEEEMPSVNTIDPAHELLMMIYGNSAQENVDIEDDEDDAIIVVKNRRLVVDTSAKGVKLSLD
jgi:exodeoxyribonuclease V alpha subunit